MNLRIGMIKILFSSVLAVMLVAVFTFAQNVRAQSVATTSATEVTSSEITAQSPSEASEIFRQKIYPYVQKNCSACHGDGKSDYDYLAPNWLHKDIASTEKQIQGYLRGDKLEQTKIYLQVLAQHWAKTYPGEVEDAKRPYGEKDIENFKTTFINYFQYVYKQTHNKTEPAAGFDLKKQPAPQANFEVADHDEFLKSGPVHKKNKIKQVATSASHACVLFENGKIKCWGRNNYGQLGYGDTMNRGLSFTEMGENLPFVDFAGEKVRQVSLGESFTCALMENQMVKCWGRNSSGELGIGDTIGRGNESINLGAGYPYSKLGSGKIKQLSSGTSSTCALFENGRVKCWGTNFQGSLGIGINRGDDIKFMGDKLEYVELGPEKVIQISSGAYSTCALFESRRLKCWGNNHNGQLGLGDEKNRGEQKSEQKNEMGKKLPYLNLGKNVLVQQVSVGFTSACALTTDARVKCWGNNQSLQLGSFYKFENLDMPYVGISQDQMGDNLPYVQISGRIQQVSVGLTHACALIDTGAATSMPVIGINEGIGVKCWGANRYGELGIPNSINYIGNNHRNYMSIDSSPFIRLGESKIQSVIAGGDYITCAHNGADAFCFGLNAEGRLGAGKDNSFSPTEDILDIDLKSIADDVKF